MADGQPRPLFRPEAFQAHANKTAGEPWERGLVGEFVLILALVVALLGAVALIGWALS